MKYRAVIFDLGGVVVGSPLHAIAQYERDIGAERGAIGRVIDGGGENGAWSRLDRGEARLAEFHPAFQRECEAAGIAVDTYALMERIAAASQPRPQMLDAIGRLRARRLIVAALTNNWASEDREPGLADTLGPHFDAVFESSVLGMRKPDPRIYRHACGKLGVEPGESVFLDDIGGNLKTARQLGMYTIKVTDPDDALAELSQVLEVPLS